MGKHFVAAGLGVGFALVFSGLYLLFESRKRNDQVDTLEFAPTHLTSLRSPKPAEAEGVTAPSARPERLEIEGSRPARADGLVVGSQGDPTGSNYEQRIEFYLESFLGPEPDILGWNALLGHLAMEARLDQFSLAANAHGETQGVFSIPGTDKQIAFEISGVGCKVTLNGEMSPTGIDHVGYRAEMGWRTKAGHIEGAYGAVQFVARDDYEEQALDKRIVGYVYDVDDERTLFRPMEARMNKGMYELRVPPPETNKRITHGSLQPAYNWHGVLSGVDTPEEVARRTGATEDPPR